MSSQLAHWATFLSSEGLDSDVRGPFTGWLLQAHPGLAERWSSLFCSLPHSFCRPVTGCSISVATVWELIKGLEQHDCLIPVWHAVPKRKAEFVAGRLCAEFSLLAEGAQSQFVGRSPDGSPMWPLAIVGAISHTDTTAYAAVARQSGGYSIGLDSELLKYASMIEEMADVFCTGGEKLRWLSARSGPGTPLMIFSAKESLFKAVHPCVKRFVEFGEAQVSEIDWAAGSLQIVPTPGSLLEREIRVAHGRFAFDSQAVHTTICVAADNSLFDAHLGSLA